MATAQAVLRIAASCHSCPSCSCRVGDEAQQGQTRSAHPQAPFLEDCGRPSGERETSALPARRPSLPDGSVWFCSIVEATAVAALEVGWRLAGGATRSRDDRWSGHLPRSAAGRRMPGHLGAA